MAKTAIQPMGVVGWREWVGFPDFGGPPVKAKIDTGARTSALHAWNVHHIIEGGKDLVSFDLHPLQRDVSITINCRAPLVGRRRIRDSSGNTQERYVVRTPIALGGVVWQIEISLTARDEMGFRMLLGRTALRRRFLVDAGRSYLQGGSLRAHEDLQAAAGDAP